ncbi:hypothetical protein BG842_10520 [Haladaptatus sp. W1]|uniref:hypothetical protein n=2 Tax=unclassified Haladaptatus TaxID=2622732 RepID=UPI0008499C80|nr:hypothetical protein [Haladaptatus sp. W1]ODR83548.1 hypothetical protein BG842_10520 [Haladaptatus sp. W1]
MSTVFRRFHRPTRAAIVGFTVPVALDDDMSLLELLGFVFGGWFILVTSVYFGVKGALQSYFGETPPTIDGGEKSTDSSHAD